MAIKTALADKGGAAAITGTAVLRSVRAYNASTTDVFLLIGDSASEMLDGTAPSVAPILLPAGSQVEWVPTSVLRFIAGIAWSVSSTRATVTATGSDANFDVEIEWS